MLFSAVASCIKAGSDIQAFRAQYNIALGQPNVKKRFIALGAVAEEAGQVHAQAPSPELVEIIAQCRLAQKATGYRPLFKKILVGGSVTAGAVLMAVLAARYMKSGVSLGEQKDKKIKDRAQNNESAQSRIEDLDTQVPPLTPKSVMPPKPVAPRIEKGPGPVSFVSSSEPKSVDELKNICTQETAKFLSLLPVEILNRIDCRYHIPGVRFMPDDISFGLPKDCDGQVSECSVCMEQVTDFGIQCASCQYIAACDSCFYDGSVSQCPQCRRSLDNSRGFFKDALTERNFYIKLHHDLQDISAKIEDSKPASYVVWLNELVGCDISSEIETISPDLVVLTLIHKNKVKKAAQDSYFLQRRNLHFISKLLMDDSAQILNILQMSVQAVLLRQGSLNHMVRASRRNLDARDLEARHDTTDDLVKRKKDLQKLLIRDKRQIDPDLVSPFVDFFRAVSFWSTPENYWSKIREALLKEPTIDFNPKRFNCINNLKKFLDRYLEECVKYEATHANEHQVNIKFSDFVVAAYVYWLCSDDFLNEIDSLEELF